MVVVVVVDERGYGCAAVDADGSSMAPRRSTATACGHGALAHARLAWHAPIPHPACRSTCPRVPRQRPRAPGGVVGRVTKQRGAGARQTGQVPRGAGERQRHAASAQQQRRRRRGARQGARRRARMLRGLPAPLAPPAPPAPPVPLGATRPGARGCGRGLPRPAGVAPAGGGVRRRHHSCSASNAAALLANASRPALASPTPAAHTAHAPVVSLPLRRAKASIFATDARSSVSEAICSMPM